MIYPTANVGDQAGLHVYLQKQLITCISFIMTGALRKMQKFTVMESAECHSQSTFTYCQISWTPVLLSRTMFPSCYYTIPHMMRERNNLPVILQGKWWQTQTNPIRAIQTKFLLKSTSKMTKEGLCAKCNRVSWWYTNHRFGFSYPC